MSNPCFVETTPSPPELCQRLCMSSATPIPENYYETSYSTIFSLDVAPQGENRDRKDEESEVISQRKRMK